MIIEAGLRFTIQSSIGAEGQNSDAFLVFDHQLNAELVAKRILKANFGDTSEFFSEAKCMYASKHNNIVEVQYACEDKDYIYLAMPYYQAGSLNSLMNHKMLTVREIVKFAIDFLNGLNHVHSIKLLHFDIKPTNILIGDDNHARLTDFGLAKYMDNYGFACPDKLYGKHWIPEAFLQEQFTMQSDIYQAGLTLYRMCNGNRNFTYQFQCVSADLKAAITQGVFPDRDRYLPHIPKKLRKIVNKCLEINPDNRYKTVLSIMNDLGRIDRCLDWMYDDSKKDSDIYRWCLDGGSHVKSLSLWRAGSGWQVNSAKVMKSTQRRITINRWCRSNFKSFKEATSFIEMAMAEL